eukprot:c5969_g1_i1.p1 GENE.c5969_g1_i1~~c5969_g1_i1.p1  ORF type:complete len:577 (-),score=154.56 c5969_g1_i1:88-1794(-)
MTDKQPQAQAANQPVLLALDVKYNEIIDFLKARQKIPDGWQGTLRAVKSKLSQAANELPQDFSVKAIKTSDFTIADCRATFAEFKSQDGEELNMFRQYKSARVQTWYKLVKLYERDCVHLGELATLLNQNTTYEVPALRKEMLRLQGVIAELQRKRSDLLRKSNEFRSQFTKNCADLKLKGNNVRAELVELVTELDGICQVVVEGVKAPSTQSVIDYYVSFVSQTHGLSKEKALDRFPLLLHMRVHGNQTVKDFRLAFGLHSAEVITTTPKAASAPAAVEIDWGDDLDTTEPAAAKEIEIDWGDDKPKEVEINWDISDQDKPKEIEINWGEDESGDQDKPKEIEINWGDEQQQDNEWVDVKMVVEGNEGNEENVHVPVVETVNAKAEEFGFLEQLAKSLTCENPNSLLLETTGPRNQLTNEFLELSMFLKQRLVELKCVDEFGLQLNSQVTGDNVAEVQRYLNDVQSVLDRLTSTRTQQLFLIKTSPKYVDRLVGSLNKKLELAKRMDEAEKTTSLKCEQMELALSQLAPQLQALITKTREAKQVAEEELSILFGGRVVHVIGAINDL